MAVTHKAIDNLLMDAMVDELFNRMALIPVPPDKTIEEEAGAGLVRTGKLQDDPREARINVLIHPARQEWQNIIFDEDVVEGFQLELAYEIGGPIPSLFRMRRYIVELRLFFPREFDRDTAREKAMVILARSEHAIAMMNGDMRSIPQDSFGSKAHAVQVYRSFLRESGGRGTFIWRGQLEVEFLVHFEAIENPQ